MLNLRPTAAPRNYLSRREARRIFWWVMAIGLTVLVVVRFGQIKQFFGSLRSRPSHNIDTRYYPSPKSSSDASAVTVVPPHPPASEKGVKGELAIDAELLSEIRDDTPWIRPSEYPAWYHLWNVSKQSPPDVLINRAQSVGFVELFQQPKAFRGKPVTIEGSARRATYLKVDDPQATVDGYYRVIVWPKGGPAEPIFLYCLDLPAGFPTGDEIHSDITATGLFFKRMVYPAEREGDLRRAPVVMARSLTWEQPQPTKAANDTNTIRFVITATVVGLIILVGLLAYFTRVSTRQQPVADIDETAMHGVDSPDVRQSLERLEEEAP